jgi:hypothetical protein
MNDIGKKEEEPFVRYCLFGMGNQRKLWKIMENSKSIINLNKEKNTENSYRRSPGPI